MSRSPSPSAAGPLPPIFLDANPFGDRNLTGIGRYCVRIAMALARFTTVRFFAQRSEVLPPGDLSWDHDQDLGPWAHRVWAGKRVPLVVPEGPTAAVYGCLRPEERLFPVELSILHDFTPQVVPATHSESTRQMFQGFYARTLLASDAALAVSHSTKADAGWLTDLPPERITVCHSGPSLCVNRHLSQTPVIRRPEVGLVVSTVEPRKNAAFVLDWFQKSETLPHDAELWWVGKLGWLTPRQLMRQANPAGGRRVKFLGVLSDAELCRTYQTAGWSLYPSFYEGFGFPVVDGLRHGTPVLASYNSSLREFEWPGLGFFDPCDADSLDLAWRRLLGGPGAAPVPGQAEIDRHYDWDRVAHTVLDLVRRHGKAPQPSPVQTPGA